MRSSRILLQIMQHVPAICTRHDDIQQDDIWLFCTRHLQPVRTIASAEDRVFLWVEVLLQEVDRVRVIIDYQDMLFDRTSLGVSSSLLNGNNSFPVGLRGGELGFITDGDHKGKGRPFPQLAFHRQVPAQQVRQVAADGESQAGAAILAGGRIVRLLEFLENTRQSFGTDANARITDRDL